MSDQLTFEQQIFQQIKHGLKDAVAAKLGGYNSPLDGMIVQVVKANETSLVELLDGAVRGMVSDESFRDEIVSATRTKLAKTLVDKLGGEIEKRVNDLKQNPTTRARITLAIEEIVKGGAK